MFYQVPRVSREGMAIARRHVSNLWRSTHRPLTGAFALASRGPAARGVGLDGRPRIPTPPSPAMEQTALAWCLSAASRVFETIRRFKGMEREVVVLVELPVGGGRLDELLYVGLTWATTELVVTAAPEPIAP